MQSNQHDLRPCSTQVEALAKSVGRECLGFGNVGVCALFYYVAPFGSSVNFCRFDSNVYSLRARGSKQHLSTSSDSSLRLCESAFDIVLHESIIFQWRGTLTPSLQIRCSMTIRQGATDAQSVDQLFMTALGRSHAAHFSPTQSTTLDVAREGRARWWKGKQHVSANHVTSEKM